MGTGKSLTEKEQGEIVAYLMLDVHNERLQKQLERLRKLFITTASECKNIAQNGYKVEIRVRCIQQIVAKALDMKYPKIFKALRKLHDSKNRSC